MAEATLSSKNQIVVPREAREALGVRAGDKLPRRRARQFGRHSAAAWTKALRGLAGQPYPEGYLDRERASWD